MAQEFRTPLLSWRPTWPVGPEDDFVADSPSRTGYARVFVAKGDAVDGHWRWEAASEGLNKSGEAADFRAAAGAVEAAFGLSQGGR